MSSSLSTSSSDRRALAVFLSRAAWFGAPILIYLLIIVVADPFRLFEVSSVFPEALKKQTAWPLNPCMWKLIYFNKHPSSHILLGDSRMEGLPEATITARTGQRYANLAFGGATANEIIDAFWFAAHRQPLKSVVIGMNLNVYNGYAIYRRTEAVESLLTNRLLYFTNRNVAEAAYHTYYAAFTGLSPELDRVSVGRENFWDAMLALQHLEYRRWAEPVAYRPQLQKISDWCRQNDVSLTFVVFPSHQDVQAMIGQSGRQGNLAAMKKEFASWGRVVDFEVDGALTRDRSKFRDPIHVTRETSALLATEIFAAQP